MGTLYVVATPIGNLEDITLRAIRILQSVPVIACEDTRRTGQLLSFLKRTHRTRSDLVRQEIKPKYISVRDWNESRQIPQVLSFLAAGDVALVSDSGTPLISDPGYKVVSAARAAGYPVSPIPGPSAVIAALSASGLPTAKFAFLGFYSSKNPPFTGMTNILFESPRRLPATLSSLQSAYPQAKIIIASEITKIHESFTSQAITTKGEAVILVHLPQ